MWEGAYEVLYRYYAQSVDVVCPLLQDMVSPVARCGVPAQRPIPCTPVPRLWTGSLFSQVGQKTGIFAPVYHLWGQGPSSLSRAHHV